MANFKPQVQLAARYKAKASIMIEGLSGSGKSGLALNLAYILAGRDWKKVGAVDTENKSLNIMVGQHSNIGVPFGAFYKIDLTKEDGYSPMNYVAAADALREIGCEAIIKDSTTHAWSREGGVLDLVSQNEESTAGKKNKFAAWNAPDVVMNKNALFEMIRNEDHHVIVTVRVKEKFGMENEGGKSTVKSLGEQQIQTEGLKYEPDLVLSMVYPGAPTLAARARVIKSRYPMFVKDLEYDFDEMMLEQIRAFLEDGADPAVLEQQQHDEYIRAVKDYCKDSANRKGLWDMLKEQYNVENIKITDIPLKTLKHMFLQLTADGGNNA